MFDDQFHWGDVDWFQIGRSGESQIRETGWLIGFARFFVSIRKRFQQAVFLRALGASLLLHAGLLVVPLGSGADRTINGPFSSRITASLVKSAAALGVLVAEQSQSEAVVESRSEIPATQLAEKPVVNSTPVASDESLRQAPKISTETELLVKPVDRGRFFLRSELTRQPELETEPVFALPPGVPAISTEPLVLRLFVSADGLVERIEIVKSSAPEVYEATAIAAFLPMKFRPGEIATVAVGSQLLIEVDFDTLMPGASRASNAVHLRGPPLPGGK